MITNKFINRIRIYFDELGVSAKEGISYDEFKKMFINTLNHCESLEDAKLALLLFKYCCAKWKKIEKIFSKYLDRWKNLVFEDSSKLRTVSDEDTNGVYYLTNVIEKYNSLLVKTGFNQNNEINSFKEKDKKISLDDDYEFYMKISKSDASIMKLFNKKDVLLCNIVLSESYDIFLEKNDTEFELIIQKDEDENTFIGVFRKSYIDSLKDDEKIEFKNMVADIEWDLLDAKSEYGVSKLTIYEDLKDITPLFYFAAAPMLLLKSFKEEQNKLSNERRHLNLMHHIMISSALRK